jgi:ADP-ribose pyrophosphatase
MVASEYSNTMNDRARLARRAWRTLSSRPVYANSWISVREDHAELPDGRTTIYGVVETKPAVGVLPFLDAHTVVLVGQYRYVARAFYWEIPTGAVKPGESLHAAAHRELREEAGYEATDLTELCTFHTSKSVLDETAALYSAQGLRPAGVEPDATEFIEVRAFPFAEALGMVQRGEIMDGMSIVAILHAARRRNV